MLVINVEVWPLGDATRRYPVGQVTITNDGTGTWESGNYKAEFVTINDGEISKMRRGQVKGFERLERDAFELLYKALGDALGKK